MKLYGGIDEAGRGPLAGPVIAAIVVLQEGCRIEGVRDSKTLSPRRRETLALRIREEACGWGLGIATVTEIDELNILRATLLAMRRASEVLTLIPDTLIIDGTICPVLPDSLAAVASTRVRADATCPAVAAASILAKVERDRIMDELHRQYPDYGFDRHRGYPTVAHKAALLRWGVTPEHRLSFAPVRAARQLHGASNAA